MSHVGTDINHCPECAKRDGWQNVDGLQFAAQVIRHEGTTGFETDLADVCEYVGTHHYGNGQGKCAECGDNWGGYEGYFGFPVPCEIKSRTKFEAGTWVIGQIKARQAKRARRDWSDGAA